MGKALWLFFVVLWLAGCGREGMVNTSVASPEHAPLSSAPISPTEAPRSHGVPSVQDGDTFQNGDPVIPMYRYQIRKYYWKKYGEPQDLNLTPDWTIHPETIPEPQFI